MSEYSSKKANASRFSKKTRSSKKNSNVWKIKPEKPSKTKTYIPSQYAPSVMWWEDNKKKRLDHK